MITERNKTCTITKFAGTLTAEICAILRCGSFSKMHKLIQKCHF